MAPQDQANGSQPQSVQGAIGSAHISRGAIAPLTWLVRAGHVQAQETGDRGFVLPTATLLLLLLALVTGGLLARSLARTQQVSSQRNQTILVNAVSPGIERAKAKLDKLFRSFGSGFIPSDAQIETTLQQDQTSNQNPNLRFTLDDEQRLDLNGDGRADNAWSFQIDITGDGEAETVGYAIISTAERGGVKVGNPDIEKADNLVARYAPLGTVLNPNPVCPQPEFDIDTAWRKTNSNSSTYRKSFQLIAWAKNPRTKETVTLELQQDREAALGNRWGAWFRNDLELFPGPDFRWNGAMHTAGNFLLTNDSDLGSGGETTLYLVSAPNSCIYSKSASQLTANWFKANTAGSNGEIPFWGQLIIGSNKLNTAVGMVYIDLYQDQGPVINLANPEVDDRIEISPNNDSVTNSYQPFDISLRPEKLFIDSISDPQGYDPKVDNEKVRDKDIWQENPVVINRRVLNQFAAQPYVDDMYRADDRWGPNPTYIDPDTGDRFSLAEAGVKTGDKIDNNAPLTRNKATNDTLTNFGLDGYWERRATRQGVRLIVGQRLELGNAFGWNPDQNNDGLPDPDPLYPPLLGNSGNSNANMNDRRNELKQWKAYRDNLAAVQSTAVYHYQHEAGEYPVACLATTAHPGTAQTITNSTTFENFQNTDLLQVNFLTGTGTNGMEFEPLPRATFEAELAKSNSNLRKSLYNLAYFAGDPEGAFPAQQASSGGVEHPYPYLTMWGNFSNLRRTLRSLNNGIVYANLSPADRTNLQTAACTLGLLAYTLTTYQQGYTSLADLSALGTTLNSLKNDVDDPENLGSWIMALGSNADKDKLRFLKDYLQIQADRRFGFQPRPNPEDRKPICEAAFSNLSPEAREGLTAALCESTAVQEIKFPALYYVFPYSNHGHGENQPETEPYIADQYIKSANCPAPNPETACQTNLYKAVNDQDNDGQEDPAATNAFTTLALAPRTELFNWLTPASLEGSDRTNKITVRGTNWYPAFLDKVIFNGREMMPVRVLDLDLDLLRKTQYRGQDFWLPLPSGRGFEATGAILYAFREDAVREDTIARPRGTVMDATGSAPTDPPLNPLTQISAKPVDYYADPDRRPYGFRLRNGVSLVREGRDADSRGVAIVSDQPIYIQGDFNLHSSTGTVAPSSLIEEFTQPLAEDWSNFYQRQYLNLNFARPTTDDWRPVEIISDAATLLSGNFCDGNLLDGLNDSNDNSGCNETADNSFRAMNRPESQGPWLHEGSEPANPIAMTRNGLLQLNNGGNPVAYTGSYLQFADDKTRSPSTSTRVNAVLVAGITPSREGQSYGGLHNFPRFLENWSDLFFQGSFIQLNFSTYATAPYDQEAWEVGQIPTTLREMLKYYTPPTRRWGFDVGLLLSPPGVVAQRFRQMTPNTNEVYRELAQDDPYVCLLRKQLDTDLSDCNESQLSSGPPS